MIRLLAPLALLAACDPADPPPVSDAAPCPPGMVLVPGGGTLGMRGQPYGIVKTAHLDKVEAPEAGCPAALASTPGATACWVQTDLVDPIVAPHAVSLSPFCIERFPFPGSGASYPADGMTTWDAAHLDELLATGRYGPRRMCTFSEFEAAVAGPSKNLRFVYGDRADPLRCGGDTPLGESAAIGNDPACRNPETGVHEYGAVHSHWVKADASFIAHACPSPPCTGAGDKALQPGHYIVAGGTGRVQTRQAPLTPHTWHDHGEPLPGGCDDEGMDDQPVLCADPDPRYGMARLPVELAEAERAWSTLTAIARQSGRMTPVLEMGLGRAVCPAPDSAAGVTSD